MRKGREHTRTVDRLSTPQQSSYDSANAAATLAAAAMTATRAAAATATTVLLLLLCASGVNAGCQGLVRMTAPTGTISDGSVPTDYTQRPWFNGGRGETQDGSSETQLPVGVPTDGGLEYAAVVGSAGGSNPRASRLRLRTRRAVKHAYNAAAWSCCWMSSSGPGSRLA